MLMFLQKKDVYFNVNAVELKKSIYWKFKLNIKQIYPIAKRNGGSKNPRVV